LTALLAQAIDGEKVELVSGAGHDGVYMSEITDVAMLFVRCKGGISHNPAESVTESDVGVALDVLSGFLELL
jgi:allantoate deiminase